MATNSYTESKVVDEGNVWVIGGPEGSLNCNLASAYPVLLTIGFAVTAVAVGLCAAGLFLFFFSSAYVK